MIRYDSKNRPFHKASTSSNHRPSVDSPLTIPDISKPNGKSSPTSLENQKSIKSLFETISPDSKKSKSISKSISKSKFSKKSSNSLEKFIQNQKSASTSKNKISEIFKDSKSLSKLGLQVSPEKVFKNDLLEARKLKNDAFSSLSKPRSKKELKNMKF